MARSVVQRVLVRSMTAHIPHTRPNVYMVKVDIKKSFDSINQEKLLDILKSLLNEVCVKLLTVVAFQLNGWHVYSRRTFF